MRIDKNILCSFDGTIHAWGTSQWGPLGGVTSKEPLDVVKAYSTFCSQLHPTQLDGLPSVAQFRQLALRVAVKNARFIAKADDAIQWTMAAERFGGIVTTFTYADDNSTLGLTLSKRGTPNRRYMASHDDLVRAFPQIVRAN